MVAFCLFIGYLIGRQNRPFKTDQTPQISPKSLYKKPLLVDLDRQTREEIRQLIKANRKIEAIKRCRTITGAGLKEAKEMVEQLAQYE